MQAGIPHAVAMRRFWGFCRRFVKSQKEPEKNLANVVLLWCLLLSPAFDVHGAMRYRTIPCDIVRYRTVSYDIVRYRTISHAAMSHLLTPLSEPLAT